MGFTYQSGGAENDEWKFSNVHFVALWALAAAAIVCLCGWFGAFDAFYPTPDIYNRFTGATTPLAFDILRPEGYANVRAANDCGVHPVGAPVASNACRSKGAPVAGNRTTRLISGTPSGCDCTCSCPTKPGDVLGVVQQITPASLNEPSGLSRAADSSENMALAARQSASLATALLQEAKASGRSSSAMERSVAQSVSAAERALKENEQVRKYLAKGNAMDADRSLKLVQSYAQKAQQNEAAVSQMLQGVSEEQVLSDVMSSENPMPANVNKDSQPVMELGGSAVSAYRKGGKGVSV